jgi:hypothetical protein
MKVATLLEDSPRTNAAVVADVQAAAQRLSIATRSWSTVEPPRAAIDEAIATCHGLRRVLAELHGRVEPQRVA